MQPGSHDSPSRSPLNSPSGDQRLRTPDNLAVQGSPMKKLHAFTARQDNLFLPTESPPSRPAWSREYGAATGFNDATQDFDAHPPRQPRTSNAQHGNLPSPHTPSPPARSEEYEFSDMQDADPHYARQHPDLSPYSWSPSYGTTPQASPTSSEFRCSSDAVFKADWAVNATRRSRQPQRSMSDAIMGSDDDDDDDDSEQDQYQDRNENECKDGDVSNEDSEDDEGDASDEGDTGNDTARKQGTASRRSRVGLSVPSRRHPHLRPRYSTRAKDFIPVSDLISKYAHTGQVSNGDDDESYPDDWADDPAMARALANL